MMRFKKLLGAVLCIAMLMSVLSGCSSLLEQIGGGSWGAEEETEPEITVPVVYDSYYDFYDYGAGEYYHSDVATYQAVTGGACELSALDWSFMDGDYSNVVEGYDARYGVFLYAYDSGLLESYRNYLTTVGYLCLSTEQFTEGLSYYFYNASNEYTVDIFVASDDAYIAIEPYLEGEVQENEGGDLIVPVETQDPVDETVSTGSCYYFYDYEIEQYILSDVETYQGLTGSYCFQSSLDWAFLEGDYSYVVSGYDETYGVFHYDYDEDLMEFYCNYLVSIGFENVFTETYTQGTSYYYQHPTSGYLMDLFVASDGEYLVIEPYINGAMQ